ncbi:MAG: type II toxin-antitoxin system PemK/MazF family toxin [Methanotrichaceae archaeon]|nr:type II toxin-antitoxin system PemK/MazF family toxin [Methanotrichaceae archaeon]
MKGDIVLVPFPNSNLTRGKLRPALVLSEDPIEHETTIAYISSRAPIIPSPCDVLVTAGRSSFDETGLKWNSVIILNKLVTIKNYFIEGLLGVADETLMTQVNNAIDACLKFKAKP